ncbi:NVEALA domain-containing protein [Albibacterium indicum]|uniref:NVEALA domain-containing protein n=1 Tax=Albibacterium indicum TaxID=2292082 RepID=UPI000E545A09
MKKYIKFIIICFAIAISCIINLEGDEKYENFLLKLEIVEALADSENPEPYCYHLGSLDCPTSTIKVKYVL